MGEEKKLVEGLIGTVGDYQLEFKDGKLTGTVEVHHGATEGVAVKLAAVIEVDAGMVIDAIEKAIPGKIDDAVLEVLRKYLVPSSGD